MNYITSLRTIRLTIPLVSFIFLLFGRNTPALGQLSDADATQLWVDQMVAPSVPGSRILLKTERDILQTSSSTASFQRGSFDMTLADGSVGKVWRDQNPFFPEEWDTDKDGWRDVVEAAAGTDPFDPLAPYPSDPADVFWTTLANGQLVPVDLTAGASTPAVTIRPISSPNVILAAVPAGSTLPRPVQFDDYSTQFYIINPATSNFELLGLSLYNYRKEYPTPADVGEMENDVLAGVYQVQFPTVANPSARTGISLAHRLVPNGTLTIGTYKKPSWLLRSASTIERPAEDPVPQTWVIGEDGVDRLRFDPELPTTFRWDDLVTDGLASGLDQMTISIEDGVTSGTLTAVGATSVTDDGADFSTNLTAGSLYTLEITSGTVSGLVVEVGSWTGDILNTVDDLAAFGVIVGDTYRLTRNDPIWPPTGAAVVVSILNPQATLLMQGLLGAVDFSLPPASRNAFMVFQYSRIINTGATGDVSTVTLRVPIEMMRSYASYRKVAFPGAAGLNDSISGPNADPDGDGLTNLQEFNQGGNPTVPPIAVSNPVSTNTIQNSFSWTTMLGATEVKDAASPINVTIIERGFVYAPSSINPFPLIDGPGVSRVVEEAPTTNDAFTAQLNGLSAGTQYSFHGYVITDRGTFYNSSVSIFSTPELPPVTIPTVTSPVSSNITGFTATLGGNVTSDGGSGGLFNPLTERGVVYSLTSINDNPFIGGVGVTPISEATAATGVFTLDVAGLIPGSTYSFRAYAINGVGVSHTSSIGTFTTPNSPTIISPTVTNVTSTSATLGGNVTSDGGAVVLERGVMITPSTGASPNFVAVSTGTGVFTVNVTLLPGTTYSFSAYARNSVGISMSAFVSFTTPGTLATLTNPTLSDITSTSATLGSEVTSDGTEAITERGFVYSVTASNSDPTIGGIGGVIKIPVTGTTAVFFSPITGLLPNTEYTFKSYGINTVGTAYGAAFAFFTTLPPLTISSPTAPIANITSTMAVLGGTVESDQGTTATGRGVVYSSTNMDPQIGGSGVTDVIASGTMGPFTVDVDSLTPDTLYYYKVYATNGAGTNYSVVSSFSTLPVVVLGLTQVEWVPESLSGLAFAVIEGSEQPQPRLVPRFVYQKSAAEMADPLNYQIKISLDTTNWRAVDQSQWTVEVYADGLTVTWASAESPPANLFFRVEVTAEN
ncbi:MAG: hypothetical protein OSA84_03485 [Akkermansiaceae bacterium]|nr:hypothetical protein [Akkermansiaceae bacterium]